MAEETKPSGFGEESDTFSLEDLDQLLEQEDPEFKESLEEIKSEALEDTSSIESLGVDSDDEGHQDEDDDREETRAEKIKKKILVPIVHAKEFSLRRYRTARNRIFLWKTQLLEFVRTGLPERWKWLKAQSKTIWEFCKLKFKYFWEKPLQERLAYLIITICFVGSFLFFSFTFMGDILPEIDDPILKSYEEKGEKLGSFNSEAEYIPLFEAFPEVEFPVRLKKVVVNLRRDEKSGSNPMGIFEFFIGLDSKDTAVEVRDREKQIIDIVQRTLEGFTYHEVMSYQGKIRMKARIRENVNRVLNQGQVNRVYINRMVTNH